MFFFIGKKIEKKSEKDKKKQAGKVNKTSKVLCMIGNA